MAVLFFIVVGLERCMMSCEQGGPAGMFEYSAHVFFSHRKRPNFTLMYNDV